MENKDKIALNLKALRLGKNLSFEELAKDIKKEISNTKITSKRLEKWENEDVSRLCFNDIGDLMTYYEVDMCDILGDEDEQYHEDINCDTEVL